MANVKIIRDSSLRIKLQPELKIRLDRLAHIIGVPPSTLGAVWLGQAIASQERGLSVINKMAESAGAEIGNAMRDAMPDLFTLVNGGEQAGGVVAKPDGIASPNV